MEDDTVATGERVVSDAICTHCDGMGWTGPVHVNMGNGKHEWRERMECYRCCGTGKITPVQAEAIRIGEEFRRARIEAGDSLADMAKRLGISTADLSSYEHGRVHVEGYGRACSAILELGYS